MTRIIISGIHGRMGNALQDLIAARSDCEVVAGIDTYQKEAKVPVFSELSKCTIHADVLIDFSNAAVVDSLLSACEAKKMPCVICTTGLADETIKHLEDISNKIAVFKSANMSLGINVLIALAKKANALLGMDYNIEIVEKHHNNKLDAPSGTALMIADAIKNNAENEYYYVYDRHEERKKRDAAEIGLHAIRGGSIVGEHDVLFCGPDEVVSLSHSAASRNVFANGAVNAALYIARKEAGLYCMDDFIADM